MSMALTAIHGRNKRNMSVVCGFAAIHEAQACGEGKTGSLASWGTYPRCDIGQERRNIQKGEALFRYRTAFLGFK